MLQFVWWFILLYLFEFIFFFLFFLYKLYFLVTNNVSLSIIGGKLNRHINSKKNITCNLDYTNFKFIFHLKSFIYNPPSWYKKVINCFGISTVILIFKISISYKFLISNVLFINFFNKTIDIVNILSNYYIYFKILYYTLFFFFIFCQSYKLYSWFNSHSEINNNKLLNKKELSLSVYIGEYNEENVFVKEKGLYQNILITGSIGSGKTSTAISNILDSLIKNNLGGLIIDIKGNFVDTVNKIAKKHLRQEDIEYISLNDNTIYNPLNEPNLSSMELASIVKKVLTLISNSKENEPFWLDKAEEYIRDFITLIRVYNNGNLNFSEIHNLVINKEYLKEKLLNIKDRILRNEFPDEKLFELNSAILNINNDYLGLDDRTFGIIRAEITRMTSVFMSNVKYSKKFCSNRVSNIRFLSNKIYVLSLDIANNEKLSKIIATYLKLKFQREILGNHKKDKSVFFLCDEYQEVCNAQDGNFFSLSREYKCINVISMQSYSSLVNSLLDEHLADVIIQNFVNKIWFRNDDYFTIQRIISILGKEKILNKSKSYTENGKNTRYNIFANKLISYKSDFSESYSENEVMQEKYTYDFFTQKLNTFEAMCMLSDGYKINLYEKIKLKIWEDDSNEEKL